MLIYVLTVPKSHFGPTSLCINLSCQKENPSMYENEAFKEHDMAEVRQEIGKIK